MAQRAQATRQTGGTHSGALSTVNTEATVIKAHTGLLSKYIAVDPDDCAATSWEYDILHYESPTVRNWKRELI